MLIRERRTTVGEIGWDGPAAYVESVDDPVPPDAEGWELRCAATTELRFSRQYILWFWERVREE